LGVGSVFDEPAFPENSRWAGIEDGVLEKVHVPKKDLGRRE